MGVSGDFVQTPDSNPGYRHRAKSVDTPAKVQKLREFVEPVKAQWQEENIKSAVRSYSGFCELLALDKAQAYLANRQAHKIQDWGSSELDAEGLALQNELEERLKVWKEAHNLLEILHDQ
jgi:exportin-5